MARIFQRYLLVGLSILLSIYFLQNHVKIASKFKNKTSNTSIHVSKSKKSLQYHQNLNSHQNHILLQKLFQNTDALNENLTCVPPDDDSLNSYPHCIGKLNWMGKGGYSTNSCYANLGVTDDVCSHFKYFSEFEKFCPPAVLLSKRNKNSTNKNSPHNSKQKNSKNSKSKNFKKPKLPKKHYYTSIQTTNLPFFTSTITIPRFSWVAKKLITESEFWFVEAIKFKLLLKTRKESFNKKTIFVYPGLLDSKSKTGIYEGTENGGPLGELVQWSDIIAVLSILGHDVRIFTKAEDLVDSVQEHPGFNPCLSGSGIDEFLIFTDIIGWNLIKIQAVRKKADSSKNEAQKLVNSEKTRSRGSHESLKKSQIQKRLSKSKILSISKTSKNLSKFEKSPDPNKQLKFFVTPESLKCHMRIVDSFGTEQPWNHRSYSTSHQHEIGTNVWGKHDFHLKQFGTLYPHTNANSFYGYVLKTKDSESNLNTTDSTENGQEVLQVELN